MAAEAPALQPVTTPPTPGLAGLFPGYFALVMATGVLAVGAQLESIEWLADVLLAVACVAYVVLVGLYAARLLRYRVRFLEDLTSHARGPAFLTIVAGTNVLGSAAVVVASWWTVGWVLWGIGVVTWIVLVYTLLAALLLKEPKPPLVTGINGTWFLFTVATQSIAALGALLAPRLDDPDGMLFACLCAFLLGMLLYIVIVTLVFFRFTFVELSVDATVPPYWISMGAVAITVLAGSNLLLVQEASDVTRELAPFVSGIVVLSWATATFWIPLMLMLGVWRHVVRRVPLRYDPQYWALVFPLGMYAVATFRMNDALDLSFLEIVPDVAFGIALGAWALVFTGLTRMLLRTLRPARGI
jgi:tellurite resistance protein TehA-like permease